MFSLLHTDNRNLIKHFLIFGRNVNLLQFLARALYNDNRCPHHEQQIQGERILPLIEKLVKSLRSLYAKYLDMKNNNTRLANRNMDLGGRIDRLYDALSQSKSENEMLRKRVIDFDRARVVLGIQAADHAVETAKEYERIYAQQKTTKKKHSRDAR